VRETKRRQLMKGLFVLPHGAGHLNPALPLVRSLIQRGHKIVVLNVPRNQEKILATGASFRSYPGLCL
jgi:UDP:flavonoid glycosyltransferase YjiC (YdhE family)